MCRAVLMLAMVSLLAAPAVSQGERDQRLMAMAESQEEFDAAQAIEAEQSPVNRLTMTSAFLTDYPESELAYQILLNRLRTYVDLNNNQGTLTEGQAYVDAQTAFYDAKTSAIDDPSDVSGYTQFQLDHFNNLTYAHQSMMNASSALNQPEDAARYAELGLETAAQAWDGRSQLVEDGTPAFQEAEQQYRQVQLFLLQTVMSTYQNANDAENTIAYAERALEIDPESLITLLSISTVMAERPPENESEIEEHFETAQDYAEKALENLERFLDAAGAQIGAEQRAGLLSGAHMTLGTVHLNREDWGDAQDEFEEALEFGPRDPIAYLRLGMAYARDEEADNAMESLARSVFLNGPPQARELLEQIYEVRNEDLTGLDAFIQSQGAEID